MGGDRRLAAAQYRGKKPELPVVAGTKVQDEVRGRGQIMKSHVTNV